MMKNKEQKYATKIFSSKENAESFQKRIGNNFVLREYKNNTFGVKFKIDKTRPKVRTKSRRFDNYPDNTDFDSEINGFGTRWHTAEDL